MVKPDARSHFRYGKTAQEEQKARIQVKGREQGGLKHRDWAYKRSFTSEPVNRVD